MMVGDCVTWGSVNSDHKLWTNNTHQEEEVLHRDQALATGDTNPIEEKEEGVTRAKQAATNPISPKIIIRRRRHL
jgi:hypothetical protein